MPATNRSVSHQDEPRVALQQFPDTQRLEKLIYPWLSTDRFLSTPQSPDIDLYASGPSNVQPG